MLAAAASFRMMGRANVVTDAAGVGMGMGDAETLDVPVTSALMVSRVAAEPSASLSLNCCWFTVSSRVQFVLLVGHMVVAAAQLFSGPVIVMSRSLTLPLFVTVTGQ